jgi:putative two-component system response regulator
MLPPLIAASRVLIAEDDPHIGRFLRESLAGEGYDVTLAQDGRQAHAMACTKPPDLVVSDLDMPHLNGFELCRRLKAEPTTRWVPVLIITGHDEQAARLRAWDLGADEFLTKPFQAIEVLARCRSLLRVKAMVDDLDSAQAVVLAFARAIEAKSAFTQGHSERVASLAVRLAECAGLGIADLEVLQLGAVLHDVGKIGIPDGVLNKPGPLTVEEYKIVKRHPLDGVRIVEPLRSLRTVLPLVRSHHERMDGAGYPDGLFAGSLPLAVRVLAVVDVFDALASARPYRSATPQARCLQIMRDNAAGGGLDPALVQALEQVVLGCLPPELAKATR